MRKTLITLVLIPLLFLTSVLFSNFANAPSKTILRPYVVSYAQAPQKPLEPKPDPIEATSTDEIASTTEQKEVETENTQISEDISAEQIKAEIKRVFGQSWGRAYQISRCESNFNPEAINYGDIKLNGHPSVGIFQLSTIHGYTIEELKDWKYNIKEAHKLFEKVGWSAWKNCAESLNIL